MIDYKQIFSEFLALESIQENKKTFNVISLPFMKHKLGVSNERFPMFFISTTNNAGDNATNIVRELLSVEYDVECTIKEVNGHTALNNFAIITLRTNDRHLQMYFIEIFLMMLTKMSHQPCKQELSIEFERLVTIFSALSLREFDIRTLRNKPAFVNDVDIHRRLFRQKVVRNKACNQV